MCNVALGLRLPFVVLLTTILSQVVVKAGVNPPEANATSSPPESTQEAAGPSAQTPRPAQNSPIPIVVSVFPADGEENVPSRTTVKIRFDRPMRPGGMSFQWDGFGRESGFRLRGPVTYDEQKFEFSIPVLLTPAATHSVALNPDERDRHFVCSAGVPAEKYQWKFRTIAPVAGEEGPGIVDVDPRPDTEIALLSVLRVRFDQPMDPEWYDISTDDRPRTDRPEIMGDVTYDSELHEFRIPVGFPANWNGIVTFRGFQGVDGRSVVPKKVAYRTLQTLMSTTMEEQVLQAGKSETLLDLLRRLQDRYAQIKSARVTTTTAMDFAALAWSYELNQSEASFARQGKQYFGDVSQIMKSPVFQVGSDGENCWFRYGNEVTVVPSAEVEQQNVAVADGFSALTNLSPEEIVARYQLEHVGFRTVGTRKYHVLRSWANVKSMWQRAQHLTGFQEWLIDQETALVFQVASGRVMRTQFAYEAVNEDIPATIFAVPAGEGITRKVAEPLDEGYSKRFLNVSDGTNGRMSLRWGKQGKKGTNSSGLN
jgi:hypothetical protein